MLSPSRFRQPFVVLALAVAAYTTTLWSQTRPAAPAQTPQERVEAAHEDLRRSGKDRALEAARLTNEIAPPAEGKIGRVPKRNYIDTIVFRAAWPRTAFRMPACRPTKSSCAASTSTPSGCRRAPTRSARSSPTRAPTSATGLIDALMTRDEFAEQWAWDRGDLLRMSNEAGPGANAFHYWFKEQLRVDRPYDQLVYDVLTPSAKVHATLPSLAIIGRSNQLKSRFVESVDDYRISNRLDHIDALTVDVGRVFLGVNTSCISCHDGELHLEDINHYLAARTRNEFFAMAAFFGKTRLIGNWNDKSRNVDRDLQVDDLAKGYDAGDDAPFLTLAESQFPRPKGAHEPAFLLTGETPRPGFDTRAELARMITAHPQFARATVNLIWGRLMTVGFVEPFDAFDLDRLTAKDPQPSNLELLEAMANDFRSNGFRLKRVIRTILQSSTYQLSSRFPGEWKDSYINFYPRHFARVMTGPEVIDAVSTVTGVPMRFSLNGEPMGRVKQLASPGDIGRADEGLSVDALMQSFFQSNRRTPPQTGNRPSTLQALLMMRSTVVNDRVLSSAKGRVQALVESPRDNDAIIEELLLVDDGTTADDAGIGGGAPRARRRSRAGGGESAMGVAEQSGVSGE